MKDDVRHSGLKQVSENMITILLSKTKMKSEIVLSAVMALWTGCGSLNTEIPADFPADVPIISAVIYRAKHGDFEEGMGSESSARVKL